MSGFLEQVPLALVLGAGFVTLLTPCGYVLLPAYISYYLGGKITFKGALRGALTSVLGIFVVFTAVGLTVSFTSYLIQSIIPYLTLIAGIIIVILGISKAFEINLPLIGMSVGQRIKATGFFTYGLVYAFTASGCTFPIFFSVILYASLTPGLGALITMIIYSVGVAIPLIITAILASKINDLVLTRLTNYLPMLHKGTGIVLIITGVYLIYYWYTNYFILQL
ncbi:MAG: cytochrome c biogenesis CcdA family protein [Candidatus Kariarchaeaceae archaeon]|jgi:cytochrome c biogenesis protein CcdA